MEEIKETVEIDIDLKDLKPRVKKMAKKFGLSVDEFINNAIEDRIRSCQPQEKNFTPHGGKHLMGKRCGYEVTEDGRYYPAPSWTDHFDDLFAERGSIEQMANSIVAQLNERLIAVNKRIGKAKRDLIEDLGVDPDKDWAYYGGSKHYLQEAIPEPEDPETETPLDE